MSMTILLVVTGFSLVLVYNNLLTSTLLHNGCGNSCVSNVSTNLEGIVTYCDHLVKSNSITSFGIEGTVKLIIQYVEDFEKKNNADILEK